MKRYWLFCHDDYYPSGGMFDFSGQFDTRGDAVIEAARLRAEKWHILDAVSMQLVSGTCQQSLPVNLPSNLATNQGAS